MLGRNTSDGGVNTSTQLSRCNTFMAEPAASIAPKHAGDDVCGRSIVMPHRSASSCKRNGFSLNSPPTVSLSSLGQVLRSLCSASSKSRVWKQMASKAAIVICRAVVCGPRPSIRLNEQAFLVINFHLKINTITYPLDSCFQNGEHSPLKAGTNTTSVVVFGFA